MKKIILYLLLGFGSVFASRNVYAQSSEVVNTLPVHLTPQFVMAIVAGILLALGFQVVLTLLSVASGVSFVGNLEKPVSPKSSKPAEQAVPLLVKISSGAGIWTIATASISLFFATLLAVKLSLLNNAIAGATLGLVIWAAFFIIMVYLEIRSVSTIIGGVVHMALQGIRYSFTGLQKVLGSSTESKIEKIAKSTSHYFSKELSEQFGAKKIGKKIDKYIKEIKPKELNYEKLREEAVKLFKEIETEEKIDRSAISLDQKHLTKVVASQNRFNKKDVYKIVQMLIEAWAVYKVAGPVSEKVVSAVQEIISPGDDKKFADVKNKIESYLTNTRREELSPERLKSDFERILKSPGLAPNVLTEKLNALDRQAILAMLSKRKDVHAASPDIVDQVVGAVNFVRERFSSNDEEQKEETKPGITEKIMHTVEDKLRNYFQSMGAHGLDYDRIKQDFITIFHHPKATFAALKTQLSQYDRESLIAMLSEKEELSSEEAERLVGKIEEARHVVLARIEKLESEIKRKAELAKSFALHEAEIIRKSTATAAWWLFGASVISGLASALGGFIAII
jgi:hypothetical protein